MLKILKNFYFLFFPLAPPGVSCVRYIYLMMHLNKFSPLLARIVSLIIYYRFHCTFSKNVKIGKNFNLVHTEGVVVGAAEIGDNCKLFQNTTIGMKNNKCPIIGNNVTICSNSVIIGEVKIGDNTVIGACSLVIKDVGGGVWAGNPLRRLK